MALTHFGRREFIKSSLSAAALTAIPSRMAWSQSTITNRLEWYEFKQTSGYASFIDAIRVMRANTNANDRNSWLYWVNIHKNSCPHGIAYFLVWHRGFVHLIQERLREISGNSTLLVPYWDYYKNPVIPSDFTDPSTGNPLFVAGRVNTNVRTALSLTPFRTTYNTFPRGLPSSFETSVEYKPHGAFHNIVGGQMAKTTSPMDPIFWLHHGMIDRLWAAWAVAGQGRQMPASSDPYWNGNLTYRTDLSLPRNQMIDTTTYLGYSYQDLRLPTALPPLSQSARIIRVQMAGGPGQSGRGRPRLGGFTLSGPRAIGPNRRSIGGANTVTLDENSVTAQIPVELSDSRSLESIIEKRSGSQSGRSQLPTGPFSAVQVVMDGARVTGAGANGGYYYDVYLNLPESGSASEDSHLLGSFGPFEIDSAQHHGGHLTFPATHVLSNLGPRDLRSITVSFVRVSGDSSPRGAVIVFRELRLELSNDPME